MSLNGPLSLLLAGALCCSFAGCSPADRAAEEVQALVASVKDKRRVTVLGPDGEPLTQVLVQLLTVAAESQAAEADRVPIQHQAKLWLRSFASAETDERGQITVPPWPAGTAARGLVYAHHDVPERGEKWLLCQEVPVQGGRFLVPETLKVGDPTFSMIEGRVTEEGQAVAGARVSVTAVGFFPQWRFVVQTGEDGRYRIAGLNMLDLHGELQRVILQLDRTSLSDRARANIQAADELQAADTPVHHSWWPGIKIEQNFVL